MYGLTSNSNLGVTSLNGLNGLAGGGYGGYGAGFTGYGYGTNVTDVSKAQEQMQNNYSIYATQQGLNNKEQAANMSFAQHSNNINSLLGANRNDDAMKEYEKLVNTIKATPQYTAYSDAEIRAIAQAQYKSATGANLIADVQDKSSSSFVQGLKMGVPILGLFESSRSREDLVSQITGTPTSGKDTTAKIFGACLSGAGVAGGLAAGTYGLAKSGVLGNIAKYLPKSSGKGGKVGLAIGAGAAILGVGAAAIKALSGNSKEAVAS